MNTKLTIAGGSHEQVAPLFDGRVTIDGVDATFESAPVITEIFRGMLEGNYDIAELGLTYFLRSFDHADPPFKALPIFPARNFRHSSVFVNTAAGVQTPKDLPGKTIGDFALWGNDASVWIKGILADEHGVTPDQSRWVVGAPTIPFPPLTGSRSRCRTASMCTMLPTAPYSGTCSSPERSTR